MRHNDGGLRTGQLFYSTQIPVCLGFLARHKRGLPSPPGRGAWGEGRDRRDQVLFIDARKLGRMVDRTHRELTDEDIRKIADTYHAWRTVGAMHASPRLEYRDLPGFCKRATLDEIRTHGYILKPGRYVGAPEQQQDDEPFEAPMSRLVAQLRQQQSEARRLKNFKELGYEA